jgi:hypothetical protein
VPFAPAARSATGHFPVRPSIAGRRPWLGLGLRLAFALAAGAARAQPAPPLELRAEGSFPLQYIESESSRSRRNTLSGAPYLGLVAIASLQPGLIGSVFVNGGHPRLGSFRDNDSTFASVGGDLVARWGELRAGMSLEHTRYFDEVFGTASNVANDVNVFASYRWQPHPGLRIRPSVSASVRAGDSFSVERYGVSLRLQIEQRLYGSWWFVAAPRLRYTEYVGADAGRRDSRAAIVSGLRYDVNESVSASILAGYDSRSSTVASRKADRFTVGASLDFDIDLMRSGPSGR